MMLLLSVSLVGLRMRASRSGEPPARQAVEATSENYRGNPEHLKRIETIIQTLRDESIDASENAIDDKELFFYPDFHPLAANAQVQLHKILANRRVIKLHDEYSALDAEARRKRCQKLFTAGIDRHKSIYECLCKSYVVQGSPKNTRSLLASQLALGAAIFLDSQLADVELLLAHLDECDKLRLKVLRVREDYPGLPEAIPFFTERHTTFDATMLTTLLVSAGEKAFQNDQRVIDAMRHTLRGVAASEIKIVPWDARLTSFDFPHVSEGVRLDNKFSKLKVFNVDKKLGLPEQLQLIQDVKTILRQGLSRRSG